MDALDISDLLPSQGFLPSSSDEEDDIGARNNKHLGNRLASIFGVPAPPKEEQELTKKLASLPIFSCSCDLETEREGQHISEGPVGISVISSNDARKYCFLVYGAQKEPKAVFVLAPEQFNLKITEDYLHLTNQKQSIRLRFQATDRDNLGTLTALYILLCTPEDPITLIPSGDISKTCEAGSTILYETHTVQITESGLQVSEKVSHKAKVVNKENHETRNFVGLHLGDITIQTVVSESVRILYLKKMKNSTTKSHSSKENTPSIVTENTESSEKIMEPQVEKPVSAPDIVPENSNQFQSETEELKLEPPKLSNSIDQYEAFHRIVGIEMDRLQIRLQDSFAKSLEAAMAPIKDEIRSIKLKQDELLNMINKHSNGDK